MKKFQYGFYSYNVLLYTYQKLYNKSPLQKLFPLDILSLYSHNIKNRLYFGKIKNLIWHLKLQEMKVINNWPLYGVILLSWGIALFEYCCQVPANRLGFRASQCHKHIRNNK